MEYAEGLEPIGMVIYILKLFCISLGTYYILLKSIGKRDNVIKVIICMLGISIICGVVRNVLNSANDIMCLVLMLSFVFSKFIKNSIGYSIIFTAICLSLNYILFLISAAISYFPNSILNIQSNSISFAMITIIYFMLLYLFFRIKRFKYGFSFMKDRVIDEYIDVLILNISVVILFIVIICANYSKDLARTFFVSLMISAIIMYVTIRKSLQLYYKQKLLIQDLEETKEELEKTKQDLKDAERENLNFSKISHSIVHKQKSLEYKLKQMMLNNETAEEIDLQDRLKSISNKISKETATIKLSKTDIPEIDDMLSYMQSECEKKKINFQLQLNGNIHYIINHYIDKEKLEILLADHIKNAIIAIESSNNVNKSILVRLGMLDGSYGLYVYDSGIEFEIETLKNLGIKPSTTHKDTGGTGMGFMNTFDTLKECKASMVIEEYGKLSTNDFTKVLKIKFDGEEKFIVSSYRFDELKDKLGNSRDTLEIVKN